MTQEVRESTGWMPQPMFAALQSYDPDISIGQLNRLADHGAPDGRAIRFVAQTDALLADGLHYEERIARDGTVPTREGCATGRRRRTRRPQAADARAVRADAFRRSRRHRLGRCDRAGRGMGRA